MIAPGNKQEYMTSNSTKKYLSAYSQYIRCMLNLSVKTDKNFTEMVDIITAWA
jgi:hypothetical protein